MLDSPLTSYSDTTPHKRIITDIISLIDPTDTPAIERLGGLDGGASKFRFVNWPHTTVEWLEDTHFPLTDTLNGSLASNTTAITVTDASKFEVGDILEIDAEQIWISAVDTGTEQVTGTRNYGGTQATHASNAAVTIIGQARVEGATSNVRAFTDRTVGSNYTQIFHNEVKVTRTQRQLSQYGISDEMEYQALKSVPAVLRLVEKQLFKGTRKAGSATTPRAFGGFGTFVTGNLVNAGGAIVQADFEDTTEAIFNDGGFGPWDAYLTPANMQVVKNLYDSSNFLRVNPDQTTLGMVIDTVRTPFGDVNLINDRWAESAKTWLIDAKHAGLLTYHPFTREPLSKDGDYDREEVVGEFTLALRQGNAHGGITGIS